MIKTTLCLTALAMLSQIMSSHSNEPWPGPRPARPDFHIEEEAPVALNGLRPKPALTLYLVVKNSPARARVAVQGKADDYIMLRSFDPDERLTHWQYMETGLDEPLYNPKDNYVHDLPALHKSLQLENGKVSLDGSFALVGGGIHQVRVNGGEEAQMVLSDDLAFGISFQNGSFTPWKDSPKRLYAYIPPQARELNILMRSGEMRIADESGSEIWNSENGKGQKIKVDRQETIWILEFASDNYEFRAWGFPLILCTKPEAARTIRASVEVLEDGTVVCHKFQRRIAQLMPEVVSPENTGNAEELIEPLISHKENWLKDPLRNAILLTGYGTFIRGIDHALREQNLDPSSPWSGAFEWKKDDKWDAFLPVKEIGGKWGTASSRAAASLAKVALLKEDFNPYYGKKELLCRAAAACLRDLMVLNEAEVWPHAADNPYPSGMSFPMGQKNLPPFGLVAPYMPQKIRSVWTEGIRRMLDRSFTNELVTCRNQSSHCLVANEEFARGTGDPVYTKLSRLYARRFTRGAHPAGWHEERTGPDASYIGMTNWHMGVYYRMSEDRDFLETIRRSYWFFNHTVAPEPDGKMLGGFNFNHRVGEGFYFEQWSGARGIVAGMLPEVGVWSGPAPSKDEKLELIAEAKERILRELANPRSPANPGGNFPGGITDASYEYYSEPDRSGVFPASEEKSFIRNFSDEMIAVKRPGYYAVCYVGKPAAGDYYISQRENFRLPLPDNAEDNGGIVNARKVNPFLGGGLSGFWTPEYGHSLLAANWAPTTHHGLIATLSDDKRYWEDYFAHQFHLHKEKGELLIEGVIESLPLKYKRRYVFLDDRLKVELVIHAAEDVILKRLAENIPIARGGWKRRGADINGQSKDDSFTLRDSRGAGVEFKFDAPRSLKIVPNGLKTGGWRKLQIGRVEIELPASIKRDEIVRLTYQIIPLNNH